MKKKNTITIILVLAVTVMTLTFGSQSPLTKELFDFEANAESVSQIPNHILYDQVFRLVISFKRKAEIQQLQSERVTTFPGYFKEEARLTEQENKILQQVALEFLQEAQPVDDQAAVSIEQLRQTSPDEQQISPPLQLTDLQQQRNALVLHYRDRLNQLLGSGRFGEFDNFVRGSFASGFQAIQDSSAPQMNPATEAAIPIIYGGSITGYSSAGRYVEGYAFSYMNYEAGLNFHPAIQGDLYRTDMPEPGLDSRYSTGYGSITAAEVFLFSANYVEGKTYCTYSTHFSIRRATGVRIVSGNSQDCKTIPFVTTPTPTPTTPTPTPAPTPCSSSLSESCEVTIISVDITPQALKPLGVSGGNNTATVSACLRSGITPLPNRQINLKVYRHLIHQNSGGHFEAFHRGNRPVGKLDKVAGVTGANGCFVTKYRPSFISGIVTIEAFVSSTFFEFKHVFVGVPNLVELQEGQNYKLIGNERTPEHPSNHWGTPAAVNGHAQIANDYKAMFYGNNPIPENDKIAYNDMSLELGGKFDLRKDWLNSSDQHGEHRVGINTDTRSSNIPTSRWVALKQIFIDRGSTGTYDETGSTSPHWHLAFLFNATLIKAERTPNSFVEDVWGAILDRGSNQAEWENWHTQLVNAKAQGQSQLLAAAKTFEGQLFGSAEYIARQRTRKEFINDVFWSHLFREPAGAETTYWVTYLANIGSFAPITEEERRQWFLGDFQSSQEFETVIFEIVDEITPPTAKPARLN